MKISLVGCGKMGGNIARGLAKEHEVLLFDRNQERTAQFAEEIGARAYADIGEAISHGEIIILAIKPQNLSDLTDQIRRHITKKQLLVSVLVGVTTQNLQDYFPNIPILCAMPNLAVGSGKGVVGLSDTKELSEEWKRRVNKALGLLGSLHWLPEKKMNALASLTGSGPAFVFIIMESIIDSGVLMGFTPDEARILTVQLLHSSLAMLEETGKHPGELKWEVTSPGGTTIAGVKAMEDHGVRSGIINTFLATYEKAFTMRLS